MPHAGAICPDQPQELIDHRAADGMSVDQGEAPLQQAVDLVGIIDEVAAPLNAVDIVGLVAEAQNRDEPGFAGRNNVAGTPLAKACAQHAAPEATQIDERRSRPSCTGQWTGVCCGLSVPSVCVSFVRAFWLVMT